MSLDIDDHRTAEGEAPRAGLLTREGVLEDYRVAYASRQMSLIGRREVLTGKAKFGIFGDGKEIPQLALAKALRPGDVRSGYYRDQTLMLALGLTTLEQLFAQLYSDTDVQREPASAGRQMNSHFATRMLDDDGAWRSLVDGVQSSADISPTASQMPRLVGLALASKLYRRLPSWPGAERFSRHGDEIAFGTIGNASCAEGMFWEAINAAGVLQVPMLLSIWDDGYGISVPNRYQIARSDLSALLSGFQRGLGEKGGCEIFRVAGWDYPGLCETYLAAAEIARRDHVPVIVHVAELTQPQGHSTSGSHERYKSPERLQLERELDGLGRMRQWMLERGIASEPELAAVERKERERVLEAKLTAWKSYRTPLDVELKELVGLLDELGSSSARGEEVGALGQRLLRTPSPTRRDFLIAAREALVFSRRDAAARRRPLIDWYDAQREAGRQRYGTHLLAAGDGNAAAVRGVAPKVPEDVPIVNGFEILNACFDAILTRRPEVVAMGEDVGKLGDVNQGFQGLQERYGELRVADTGIRECTIMGQAIGLAMRGFRPIAEIQYLDYILYALQILSDDLATLRYRTASGQQAPVIVRTRGHRLEGIWHSGSPMAGILNLLRGVHLCVPRDMTRAAGFYNTLLASRDPGIVVEVLNGYRLKEPLPANIGELRVPLGRPEVLRSGADVTVVTYGACCRLAMETAEQLAEVGIETEVIDVQTLLPFDLEGTIVDSLKRTSRVVFLDEDVPGGATSFMAQQVLEHQGGFWWLDAAPVTVTAKEHRPAYGSDGDYFSKPQREDLFDAVYRLLHEADPGRFPLFCE